MVEEQTITWMTVLENWLPLVIPLLSPLLLLPNRMNQTHIITQHPSRLTLADATASKVLSITRYPDARRRRINTVKNWQYASLATGFLIFIYCIALWILLPGLRDKTENITPLTVFTVFLSLVTLSIIGITIWNIIALHTRKYSPTAKQAIIKINGGFEQITMRCLAATFNMGAHITELVISPISFFIDAQLEGGRLNIKIHKVEGAPLCIEIYSDSYLPIVIWDHGINAKNLSTFTEEYFKVQ